MKEETRHTIPRVFVYHFSVMANAAASREKKPFATRWVDDEVDMRSTGWRNRRRCTRRQCPHATRHRTVVPDRYFVRTNGLSSGYPLVVCISRDRCVDHSHHSEATVIRIFTEEIDGYLVVCDLKDEFFPIALQTGIETGWVSPR